jgi:hypothetical protein
MHLDTLRTTAQQLCLVGLADVIISAAGGISTLAAFARPGAGVVVSEFWDEARQVSTSYGTNYSVLKSLASVRARSYILSPNEVDRCCVHENYPAQQSWLSNKLFGESSNFSKELMLRYRLDVRTLRQRLLQWNMLDSVDASTGLHVTPAVVTAATELELAATQTLQMTTPAIAIGVETEKEKENKCATDGGHHVCAQPAWSLAKLILIGIVGVVLGIGALFIVRRCRRKGDGDDTEQKGSCGMQWLACWRTGDVHVYTSVALQEVIRSS